MTAIEACDRRCSDRSEVVNADGERRRSIDQRPGLQNPSRNRRRGKRPQPYRHNALTCPGRGIRMVLAYRVERLELGGEASWTARRRKGGVRQTGQIPERLARTGAWPNSRCDSDS